MSGPVKLLKEAKKKAAAAVHSQPGFGDVVLVQFC